jgi:anthranilate synthase/aminodeoxychorismate synthase-like glutamine amidotransferase
MRVAIVDCYDSFTYNLFQLLGHLGAEPIPVTCDRPLESVKEVDPDLILLSPGPGTPEDSGVCPMVIREFAGVVPILGVCLGHQTIVHTFGGKITRMGSPMHGKTSNIFHSGAGIFSGLPNPFPATRYHSLMVAPEDIPDGFDLLAFSGDDGCIMAVSHRELPVIGVQFHPESIMTPSGRQLLANFLALGGA